MAFAAGFYILVNEVLQKQIFFETYRFQIWSGLVGGGVFLGLIGRFFGHSESAPPVKNDHSGISLASDDEPATRFFTARYCGFILSTFGAIVRVAIPTQEGDIKIAARARNASLSKTEQVVTNAVPEKGPVAFPDIMLQGIFYGNKMPSAILNKKTYFVGDIIEGVKILSIYADSIVVEKDGVQRVVLLRH